MKLPCIKGFEYLAEPIFETKEVEEEVIALTAIAKSGDRIPTEKIWLGIFYEKELRNGFFPPLSIRFIDDHMGYGVFAEKKISPCSFVGEYSGIIQQRMPKLLKKKKYCLRYTMWEGKKNYCIDAENRGNFTRFINHSDKPNLVCQSIYSKGLPRMIFVALKEIPVGAELTFDYGPLYEF